MIHVRGVFAAAGSLLFAALCIPACGGSDSLDGEPGVGIDAGGAGGTDGGALCTLGSGKPLCQVCVNARCLAECKLCESTQDCEAALACLKTQCAADCGGEEDASAAGTGGGAGAGGGGGEVDSGPEAGDGEAGAAGQAGTGGGPDAATPCAINFGIASCNACISAQCLEQCNNCAANAECVPLLTCIRQCKEDFVCEAQCRLQHTSGVGPEELLWGTFGCRKQSCATECAGEPQCGLQTGTAGCDTCINEQCFGECDTCANQAECSAVFQCIKKNCTAPYQKWCVEVCALQHPSASATLGAFWGKLATPGCVESKCDAPCLKPTTATKCALNSGAIACDTCIDTACMTECDACSANAECVAIHECVKGQCAYPYQDAICISGCTVKHLGGATDFLAFWSGIGGCVKTKCGLVCQ